MKQLTVLLLVCSLLLSLAGCSASGAARTLDTAEDLMEEKLEAVEDSAERAIRKAATPEPTAVPADPIFDPVTKEKAEQIALDHLGLSKNQVTRLRTDYEIDDGIGHYDVQFYSGDWEYEFEIHAETGKILSCDRDSKYD